MQYIEIDQLKKKLKSKKSFLLLDVREGEEHDSGAIPKSVLIPWHIIKDKIKGIRKDKDIVVYCENISRSLRAAKSLEELGYNDIKILKHGYAGWLIENE